MSLISNTAQDLGYLDSEQNDKYGEGSSYAQSGGQSPQQTIAQKTIGALADPFNNAMSNFNTTKDAFSGGHVGQGLLDTYAMAKNPTGNWGGQKTQSPQTPAFEDHHLGEPDENGIRPFTDAGRQHAIANANPIPDNTGLVSAYHGSGQPPAAPVAQLTKGLIGKTLDSAGSTAMMAAV